PGRVDSQTPVGVPVVRDAEIGAGLDDGRLERLDVCTSAVLVDVVAVRLSVDHGDPRPGSGVRVGCRRGRGAIRAVDHDVKPGQRVGCGIHEMADVALNTVFVTPDPPDVRAGGSGPLPG